REAITPQPDLPRLRKVQVLRTPNRPDLYPESGIRLRLGNGVLCTPGFAPLADAVAQGTVRTWNLDDTVGYSQSVAVWVTTVTRDGVPSLPAGPMVVTTPMAPPPSPALIVTQGPVDDQASWVPAGNDITYRLERSLDGGGIWQAVSPWLPA